MKRSAVFEPDINNRHTEGTGGEWESIQGACLEQRYETNQKLAESFATALGFDPAGAYPQGEHKWPEAITGTASPDAPKHPGVVQGEREGFIGPTSLR